MLGSALLAPGMVIFRLLMRVPSPSIRTVSNFSSESLSGIHASMTEVCTFTQEIEGYPPPHMRERISTTNAPGAIGPYSQAIRTEGKFVFLSGQVCLTPSGEVVQGDIKVQAVQVMANLKAVLEAAGLTFENVVKTTIFLSSMDHFAKVNEVYGSYFAADPPARSTVAVAGLPRGVDVEIEMVAVY